jgi:hypothetical protein
MAKLAFAEHLMDALLGHFLGTFAHVARPLALLSAIQGARFFSRATAVRAWFHVIGSQRGRGERRCAGSGASPCKSSVRASDDSTKRVRSKPRKAMSGVLN